MNENGYKNKPLDRIDRRLDGPVYIGVAASELAVGQARDSMWNIQLRNGDSLPQIAEFTKGVEAREYHTRRFLEAGQHEFILHLDGDMKYPPDLLERLRSHGLACVSGLYWRRTFKPMIPIWFEDDPEYRWPMMPFRYTPEPGQMYRLGGTGAGCWLIHRSVYEAVDGLLKGEPFWQEDAMTFWPYDIQAVASGRETPRILRGTRDRVGADLRLGFWIRQAGFTIWGDAAAMCGHYVPYPLGQDDWESSGLHWREAFAADTTEQILQLREAHLQNAGSIAKVVGA